MKTKYAVKTFFVVISFFLISNTVLACGPSFLHYIYDSKDVLDSYYPLNKNNNIENYENHPILNNSYEVLTRGLGPTYLLPVFLYGEGNELNPEFKNLLFKYYTRPNYTLEPFYLQFSESENESEINKAKLEWFSIRNKYLTDSYTNDEEQYNKTYCSNSAVIRAVKDYGYRETVFSEKELKEWVSGQDQVFQDCTNKNSVLEEKVNKKQSLWQKTVIFFKNLFKKESSLEEITPSDLLKYDKEYQEAASAYYLKNYAPASKLFENITYNKKHPHRHLAALSLGWSYLGSDELNYEKDLENKIDNADENYISNLKETQKYYEKIYSAPEFELIKDDVKEYLDYATYRTDPLKRLMDAETVLLNLTNEKDFSRNLDDFERLWYKYFQRVLIYNKDNTDHEDLRNQIIESNSSFLKFMAQWEKPTNDQIEYSIQKYNDNQNPLWIILALRQLNEDDSNKDFIKGEINKVQEDSPFYFTAQYYLVEYLVKEESNNKEITTLTGNVIKKSYTNKQFVAFNLFSDIREYMFLESNNSLEYSIRYPVAKHRDAIQASPVVPYYAYDYLEHEDIINTPVLSTTAKIYLSSLNSEDLTKFVINNADTLPDSLKRYLKLTVFNRLFVLDDLNSMDLLAKNIVSTDSTLSTSFNKYLWAKDPEEKRFLAASIIIDYPTLYPQIGDHFDVFSNEPFDFWYVIDNYRRNWVEHNTCRDERYRPDDYFESEIDKQIIEKNSVNYLGSTIVDYTENNTLYTNPKVLHQVVNMGRYAACKDDKTADISKRAFELLHTRYPGNYWTEQTPYWYQ